MHTAKAANPATPGNQFSLPTCRRASRDAMMASLAEADASSSL